MGGRGAMATDVTNDRTRERALPGHLKADSTWVEEEALPLQTRGSARLSLPGTSQGPQSSGASVWGDAASTSTGWAPPGTAPPARSHRAALTSPRAPFPLTPPSQRHGYWGPHLGAHSHLVTLVCYTPCGLGGFVSTFGVWEVERALRFLCMTLNTHM